MACLPAAIAVGSLFTFYLQAASYVGDSLLRVSEDAKPNPTMTPCVLHSPLSLGFPGLPMVSVRMQNGWRSAKISFQISSGYNEPGSDQL